MNQAHDILRRLFDAMETPRSAVATKVWDEAREFLKRPDSPDLSDAVAYMTAQAKTGRARSEPEMQNLPGTLADKIARLAQGYSSGPQEFKRRIGMVPELAAPYSPSPRRMVAEDLSRPGGPAYDALLELERNDRGAKIDYYLQMSRALELAYWKMPEMLLPGSVFGMDFKDLELRVLGLDLAGCNCKGEGFGGGRHTKDCPKYVNPGPLT